MYAELAMLAMMLAATDAALGKAVITNKLVPAHIRETLHGSSYVAAFVGGLLFLESWSGLIFFIIEQK